ncbi:hypothetical protein K432DRAFT_300734 [Lepidopterella palustris CBS 459.81]|uniref:Delta 8-(E)-sphingolipid desaturase n=1 Tax=Lepidopterella palustris CBS 459.81 TaxID=1314670 RepID=A0A8E2E7X9_9PEZI|nr:hypothetical protein K432DRAFT_300734 [Lepidopterella palustris CBS 459.81]
MNSQETLGFIEVVPKKTVETHLYEDVLAVHPRPGKGQAVGREQNQRQITIEEVEAADTAKKPWVAIRGKVYDLTTFVGKHPGGKDFLLATIGRDATMVYESMHSDKNTAVLNKYKIGTLFKTNMPQYVKKSEFKKELEKRVYAYFTSIGKDPKDAPWMLLTYGILVVTFAVTYYGMFSRVAQYSVILPWAAAVVNGWSAAMMGFYILHDFCHSSFTRRPWVWQAGRRVYESITGLISLAWFYQHVVGHHTFTNVIGVDPDIMVFDPGPFGVHHELPWRGYYILQQYYWFIAYSQFISSRKLLEWKQVFYDRRYIHVKINPVQMSEYFWGAATLYYTHHYVLPFTYFHHSILRILALHTVSDVICSIYLALITQLSHVNSKVEWPEVDSEYKINEDWAVLQIEASLDYGHGEFWPTWLSGSLNYQAVHHMFPHASQYYYPEIAGIVKDTCKEYGVRYNMIGSTWETVRVHMQHLRLFGEKPGLR